MTKRELEDALEMALQALEECRAEYDALVNELMEAISYTEYYGWLRADFDRIAWLADMCEIEAVIQPEDIDAAIRQEITEARDGADSMPLDRH